MTRRVVAPETARAAHTSLQRINGLGLTEILREISVSAQKRRRPHGNAKPINVGPTPERLAKGDELDQIAVPIVDADTRASSRSVKASTVFEQHRTALPGHLAAALQAALDDFDAAIVRNAPLIASYGEGTTTAYGPRHGGVPDAVRAAFSRLTALQAYLGPERWTDLLAYVCECANARRHAEAGTPYAGAATARAYHQGWDRATVLQLAKSVAHHQQRERGLEGKQFTRAEITAGLQARREAMARKK